MADRTIVPTNFQQWPTVGNLTLLQRFVARELWCNSFINSCGCYHLPISMFAANLTISIEDCNDAILELERRKEIELDRETGEILIAAWWRYHKCVTAIQIAQVQRSIANIKSKKLKKKVITAIKKTTISIKDKKLKSKPKPKTNSNINITPSPILPLSSCGEGGGGVAARSAPIPPIQGLSADEPDIKTLMDEITWEASILPYRTLIMRASESRPLADIQLLADELASRLSTTLEDPLRDVKAWLRWKACNLDAPTPGALAIQHARHQKSQWSEAGPL